MFYTIIHVLQTTLVPYTIILQYALYLCCLLDKLLRIYKTPKNSYTLGICAKLHDCNNFNAKIRYCFEPMCQIITTVLSVRLENTQLCGKNCSHPPPPRNEEVFTQIYNFSHNRHWLSLPLLSPPMLISNWWLSPFTSENFPSALYYCDHLSCYAHPIPYLRNQPLLIPVQPYFWVNNPP